MKGSTRPVRPLRSFSVSSIVETLADSGGGTASRAIRGALRGDGRLPLRTAGSWLLELPDPSEPSLPTLQETAAPVESDASGTLALQIFEAPRGESGAFERPWIAELPDPVSTVMWFFARVSALPGSAVPSSSVITRKVFTMKTSSPPSCTE